MPCDIRIRRRGEHCAPRRRTLGRLWLAVALILALGAAAAPATAAENTTSVRKDIETILSSGNYQRNWPDAPSTQSAGGSSNSRSDSGAAPEVFRFSWKLHLDPVQAGTAVKIIVVVAIIVFAAILLSNIFRRRRPDQDAETAAEPAGTEEQLPPLSPLEDIERLARDGRLEEAVHLLLLRFIEDIRERTQAALRPALTSREVLARTTLPDDAKSGFSHVVASVEHSHFGGQPISRETFEQCLAGYRAFASAGTN
jgi:hypothetical protein